MMEVKIFNGDGHSEASASDACKQVRQLVLGELSEELGFPGGVHHQGTAEGHRSSTKDNNAHGGDANQPQVDAAASLEKSALADQEHPMKKPRMAQNPMNCYVDISEDQLAMVLPKQLSPEGQADRDMWIRASRGVRDDDEETLELCDAGKPEPENTQVKLEEHMQASNTHDDHLEDGDTTQSPSSESHQPEEEEQDDAPASNIPEVPISETHHDAHAEEQPEPTQPSIIGDKISCLDDFTISEQKRFITRNFGNSVTVQMLTEPSSQQWSRMMNLTLFSEHFVSY